MSDFYSSGMAWFNGQMRQHNGSWVTYKRGNVAAQIRATPGASLHESNDADGATVAENTYDWIITVSELQGNGFDEPRAGDLVHSNINGRLEEFQVVYPLGVNRYDRVDQGNAYRVHTVWKGVV